MPINENIQAVIKRIEKAANKSGRDPKEITLLTVTKNQPISAIKEVIDVGIVDLGENRVQELLSKHGLVDAGVKWHFIGHLQRNKVKYIVPLIYLIQSVDSIVLAGEINKRAKGIGKVQDILLEVNVSGEKSKHGFSPEELLQVVDELSHLESIYIKGLMMMAPYVSDTELLRPYFAKLKKIFDNLSYREGSNIEMSYLSMGMTNDFEIAIEEGSNMVRIGTAIFNP